MSERARSLSIEKAVERLMSGAEVLIGADFDGTLAPIVDHPDDAVPDPRALELLREISGRPALTVAVVSGRALDDLQSKLGEVPGAILVGEHGNDIGRQTNEDPRITAATSMIDEIAERLGATVEHKHSSVSFHYRNLSERESEEALERIRSWANRHEEVQVLEGKKVIELSTASKDKGDAIREIAGSARIIYIGDDTTDETVFRVLGPEDVGVKVGEGNTSASHRVEDIDGVVTILTQIALASG